MNDMPNDPDVPYERKKPGRVYVVEKGGKFLLRWINKAGGKTRQKTLDCKTRRAADKAGRAKELELATTGEGAADLDPEDGPVSIPWTDFCERYESERLPELSVASIVQWSCLRRRLRETVSIQVTFEVNSKLLSKFAAERRKTVNAATAAKEIRTLKAALSWGKTMGFVKRVPGYKPKKADKRQTLMRSRPISEAEYLRVVAVLDRPDCPSAVVPGDKPEWRRYLRCLWLSGLRASEAVALSWDDTADFSVDLDAGKHPRYRIFSEGQKGRRDEFAPMTPDCADFFAETPAHRRRGPVFFGGRFSHSWAKRVIADLGRAAGVVVGRCRATKHNPDGKSFASSHTLRRSYGTRWAIHVQPAVLQKLMRHANIATTMGYYVHLDAERIGDQLFEEEETPAENADENPAEFSAENSEWIDETD